MKDSPPNGDEGFRFRPWSNRLRALPRPVEDELIDLQEGEADVPEPDAAPEVAAAMIAPPNTDTPLPAAAAAAPVEPLSATPPPAAAPPPTVAPPPPSAADESPAGFRLAATESMKSALDMLRAYPGDYRDAIRARSEERAAELRARADQEMALIGERAEAEIARIHHEAAFAVTARRTALDDEIATEQSRREGELQSTDADIAAFDAQLAAFQAQALDFLGRVTTVGQTPPAPVAAAAPMPVAPVLPPALVLPPAAQPAPAQQPLPAPQPAVVEPAAPEPERAAQESPMAQEAAPIALPESMTQPSPTEVEPERVEVEAAAEPEPEPETVEPEPVPDPDFDGTTVSVRGLSDIASIAAFMRPLSRTHGIDSVQIRSAQNGEVTFAVVHGPDVDVDAAIRATPHFDIEILEAHPRMLTLRASERLSPPESRPAD
jgi:hypothetical protein